ncbi:hypothetical protein ABPG72_020988 [Tetrahymena utriculariae]
MSKSNYEDCLGNNFTEPFDPRCRQWYVFSKQNEGYFFYEPYSDAFEKTLTMTLSSQITKNGQFQSVNSIDFNMKIIIDHVSRFKSANQYSVLFHEFNNTLFYHHQLTNNQIMSWEDLEFQNITQGNLTEQQNDQKTNEKFKFKLTLLKTLDFIKTGNYSMNEQINIDELYQKWSKLGIKYKSMVCPIKSKIKKYKTQEPYSYSIILAAKVIQDQSDTLKLFNIMNINTIKIPIIVESVQRPIEILIRFLKKSLQQQHQCQVQIYTKKDEKVINHSNLQKMILRKRNTTTNLRNNFSKFKSEEQVNTLFSLVHNENPCPSQASFNNLQFFNQCNQLDRKLEKNRTIQLFSKVNLKSKINLAENTQREYFDSYIFKSKKQRHYSQQNFKSNQTSFKSSNQQLFNQEINNQFTNSQKNNTSFKSFQNSPEFNLSNRYTSQSQLTQDQKEKNKEESKENILQGLKPLFLEMKIIKEAFQNLEKLINYQIDANQNQQDQMNTLYHFAKAKNTFQRLSNQSGLSRCYFNLGVIHILRNEFSFASHYLESSVWLNMAQLGIDSLYKIKDTYSFQHDTEQEEWLQILSKRIFTLAYSQKQVAFQMIYQEKEDYLMKNSSLKNFQHKLIPPDQMQQIKSVLKKSLDAFNAIQNLFNNRSQSYSVIFQIYIYQEIAEILIHLDHKIYNKQIQKYINSIFKILSQINLQQFKFNQRPVSLNDYKLSDESHHIIHEDDIEYLSNSNTNQNDTQTLSQGIANKMVDIINNRQKLILGYLELVKENDYYAILYLTQTLEDGKFYSPLLRKKTIFYLNQLFDKVSFKQDFIDELILNLDNSVKIDLTLLLQMGSFQHNFNFDCCLQYFLKSNFFRPQDRIQVIIFNEKLEEFLPLTLIQSQHHLASIIYSIQSKSKQLIQNYKKNICTELNWQSAIIQSLEHIQQLSYQQLIELNNARQKIEIKQNPNHSQIKLLQFQENLKNKRQNTSKQNKKVVILFSKTQNINQQLRRRNKYLPKRIPIHPQPLLKQKDIQSQKCQHTANQNSQFLRCSQRELVFNECPKDIYTQLSQSELYVDLYFVRSVFKYDLLTNEASYLSSQMEGLLVIKNIYNLDSTSLLSTVPSTSYKNVTNSQFQYCLGSNFIEPFDPQCRPWYVFSKQHKDAVLGTLIMTLSSQVSKNNQFQSLNSIDFDMIDIVKQLNTSQIQNQYSVLFHEFNNTIFSHPLLSDQTLISQQDLKYLKIQDKNLALIEYDKALQEKNIFISQIQKSIDFIKNGNYSIQQQFNIDQLFQQWSKFGIKYLSLVFPLKSQNTQFQNQEPYSNSIILIARVLLDESDGLRLFNLLNINYIQIPLILEFVLIYVAFYTKKDDKQPSLPNLQKIQQRKKNLSKNMQSNLSKFKNEDQTNTIFSPSHAETPIQATFNNLQINLNNLIDNDKNTDQQKTMQLFSKNNLLSKNNFEEHNIIDQLDRFAMKTKKQRYYSQQNPKLNSTKNINQLFQYFDSNNDFTNAQRLNTVKSIKNNNLESQISVRNTSQSQSSQCKKKEVDKNKILQGLKPLFLEMKIIKEAFQNLERLINYEIDSNTNNSQDSMNTLYHFAKAKYTFQRLKNENGLSSCYQNLGIIYVLKNQFSVVSQYFESSIQLNFTSLGIDSLKQIHENFMLNCEGGRVDWLIIFSKRIFAFAYCQNQIAFQM